MLKKELQEIEQYLPHFESSNDSISNSTVGWQIDHSLRVMISVARLLAKSNPEDYKWSFNTTRTWIFLINKIPRGKAKAPKYVVNSAKVTRESLDTLLQMAREELNKCETLPPKSNLNHPYFGLLNLKHAKRFLEIHTQHHLKIVRDILNK